MCSVEKAQGISALGLRCFSERSGAAEVPRRCRVRCPWRGRRCVTHPARPAPSVVQQRRQLSASLLEATRQTKACRGREDIGKIVDWGSQSEDGTAAQHGNRADDPQRNAMLAGLNWIVMSRYASPTPRVRDEAVGRRQFAAGGHSCVGSQRCG